MFSRSWSRSSSVSPAGRPGRISVAEHLATWLVLLAGVLFIFRRDLFRGEAIYFLVCRDLNPFASFLWYHHSFQSLVQGYFPLWNPWRGMGFPQLANYQSAFFSPLLAPLFLLPLRLVAVPYLLLRLALAGWGAYLYARHLSLRHWPAVLTGVAFGLSGWMIQYVNNQHLVIDLLLPFLLISLDRLLVFYRGRDFLWFGLVVLLILLGGQPSSALFSLGLGMGYALWRRVRSGREVVVVGAALALAGLGALAQIFPFLEFIPQAWTYHPPGVARQFAPLPMAVTLLAPGFFGRLWQLNLPGMATLPYLGAIPAGLALAGLLHFRKLRAPAGFFALTAVAGLGLVHGLPGFAQFMSLPGLNRLFFIKYCQPLYTFAVAILAGLAVDRLSRRELWQGLGIVLALLVLALSLNWNWMPQVRSIRLLSFGLAATGAVLAALFARRPLLLALLVLCALAADSWFNQPMPLPLEKNYPRAFFARLRAVPPDYPRLTATEEVLPVTPLDWEVDDFRIADAMFIGRMMRYLNLLNGHTPEQAFTSLIHVNFTRVVPEPERFQGPLADLARLRWFLNREPLPLNTTITEILRGGKPTAAGPGYLYATTFELKDDLRRVLFQHPPSRMEIPAELTAPHSGLKFGLALDPKQWPQPGDGVWFQALAAGRMLFCRHLNPSQRDSDRRWVDEEFLFHPPGPVALISLPGPSSAYDWSGWGDLRWQEEPVWVGWIQPGSSEVEVSSVIVPDLWIGRHEGARVHENREAFPLARLVGNWQGAPDMEESERALVSGRDLKSWAVVEGFSGSSEGQPAEPGRVEVVEKKDSLLRLAVDAEQESLLLITDNYFPGWQAKVEGRPARIYPADLTFRGIFVPAGRTQIEMIYRPWAFRLGLWLSLVTGLMALCAFFFLSPARSVSGFRPDSLRAGGARENLLH